VAASLRQGHVGGATDACGGLASGRCATGPWSGPLTFGRGALGRGVEQNNAIGACNQRLDLSALSFLLFCRRFVCEMVFAVPAELFPFVHMSLLAPDLMSGKVFTDDHNAPLYGHTVLSVQFAMAHLP